MANFLRKIVIAVIIGIALGSFAKNPGIGFLIFVMSILFFVFKSFNKLNKPKTTKKKENIIDINKIKMPKISMPLIMTVILILLFVYFFRPWFHGFFMAFYIKPALLFFFISLIISLILFKYKQHSIALFFLVLAVISFLILPFSQIIEQRYIVTETTYNEISTLPDTTNIRILPRAVAFRYLEDSLQKSRERVGGINIVNINGSIFWVAPRVPDGTILYFTQKVNGIMIADASKVDRTTKLITRELQIGEDTGIFDNIYWNLYKKRYFVDFGDIYYILAKERILTVAPIIAYKFKFPVRIPVYEGVIVLDEDGTVTSYTPQQVERIEEFQDNRAYPGELARLYVDSYKYNLGVLNKWFFHEDQIEISDVYGFANRQPFLMPTTDGLKWIIATEPVGQSYGVFKIFLVDALTGKIDLLPLNEDDTLTGPVRVVSYVKKKFPIIDWSATSIVEPRPIVIDGKLFWMLSITPNDYAGIAFTVFINSANNEVFAFDNAEAAYDFVKKGFTEESIGIEDLTQSKDNLRVEKIKEIEKLLEELRNLE